MLRTMVVTGAASGIGKATLELAQSRGWRVIGVDLQDADVIADLSTSAGRDQALIATNKVAGAAGIDAVVTCAGLLAPAAADAIAKVNFFGSVVLLEGLLPRLRESAAARAVAISSTAVLQGDEKHDLAVDAFLANEEQVAAEVLGDDAASAYIASKIAISRWARIAAVRPEWAGSGVLLNTIAPGPVSTPMLSGRMITDEGRAVMERFSPTRTGRYAEASDVAELACFLASAENRHIVGQTIFCDGGAEAALRPAHLYAGIVNSSTENDGACKQPEAAPSSRWKA